MGYLISDTTKEEREKIVADSLGTFRQSVTAAWLVWLKCIRIILRVRRNCARLIWSSARNISRVMKGRTGLGAVIRNREYDLILSGGILWDTGYRQSREILQK